MCAEGVDLQIREEWLEAAHSLEMKAAGVDVEIPQRRLEKSRRLDIFVAGGFATYVFDMPGGGAAFAIWVRLVARRLVILLDWAMTTAWDDQIVPQAFFDERIDPWRLGQRDFPQSEVLTMRIMEGLTLNPGRMAEGWLLAIGLYPMPEAFHHGMTVPFTLELWDQYENEIRHEFKSRALQLIQGRLPADEWEWYFLMQHYGVPTRLLDWTENPLIAIYFAVEGHKADRDAAVWALDPTWLNRKLRRGIEGVMLHDWSEAQSYLRELEDAFSGVNIPGSRRRHRRAPRRGPGAALVGYSRRPRNRYLIAYPDAAVVRIQGHENGEATRRESAGVRARRSGQPSQAPG